MFVPFLAENVYILFSGGSWRKEVAPTYIEVKAITTHISCTNYLKLNKIRGWTMLICACFMPDNIA